VMTMTFGVAATLKIPNFVVVTLQRSTRPVALVADTTSQVLMIDMLSVHYHRVPLPTGSTWVPTYPTAIVLRKLSTTMGLETSGVTATVTTNEQFIITAI